MLTYGISLSIFQSFSAPRQSVLYLHRTAKAIDVLGLGEHAAVELQDADFPVEKQRLRGGYRIFLLDKHGVLSPNVAGIVPDSRLRQHDARPIRPKCVACPCSRC